MRKIYRDKGLLLIPLPGNKGLNVGRYFSGFWSIREWPWAVYDFADHVSPWSDKAEWADGVLRAGTPNVDKRPRLQFTYECWKCSEWHETDMRGAYSAWRDGLAEVKVELRKATNV